MKWVLFKASLNYVTTFIHSRVLFIIIITAFLFLLMELQHIQTQTPTHNRHYPAQHVPTFGYCILLNSSWFNVVELLFLHTIFFSLVSSTSTLLLLLFLCYIPLNLILILCNASKFSTYILWCAVVVFFLLLMLLRIVLH